MTEPSKPVPYLITFYILCGASTFLHLPLIAASCIVCLRCVWCTTCSACMWCGDLCPPFVSQWLCLLCPLQVWICAQRASSGQPCYSTGPRLPRDGCLLAAVHTRGCVSRSGHTPALPNLLLVPMADISASGAGHEWSAKAIVRATLFHLSICIHGMG